MSLTEARARLASYPGVSKVATDAWLTAEESKGRGHWHPLYDWLESETRSPDLDAFCAALEEAVTEPLRGRAQSRRKRLVQDPVDYWSALCELYMATCLHRCGLDVDLSDPDLLVAAGDEHLALELTSRQQSNDLERLVGMLREVWRGPYAAIIETDDWEVRIPLPMAKAIVGAFMGAAGSGTPIGPIPLSAGAGLRASIEPGGGDVRVRSGAAWGFPDVWAELQPAIDGKRRQLRGHAHGVVAIELGHTDPDSHMWRIAVGFGHGVTLSTDANIDGVLVYWQDVRRHCPAEAVFVPNEASPGPSPLLRRVLGCLGVSTT